VLRKFKPIIQLETWGEHKPVVEAALNREGFEKYYVNHSVLKKHRQERRIRQGI
jgi:hypothetical protein